MKASGEDGFLAIFFQQFWHIVGDEVTDYCLGILNRGNCIYGAQSAFVQDKLILDNVLIAYEIFHTFRQKRVGKKGFMELKLDMSKVYDRVEWYFLKVMMLRMGFHTLWVENIMKCVISVSYSVIINGRSGQTFKPTRGIRQGDPLSPSLFLMFSEGLSALIRMALRDGSIKGAKVSRGGLSISHLLFSYDSILFGEASERGAQVLKSILREYERCSGQSANYDKSTVFYSSNTLEESRRVVSNILGVRNSNNMERYLGLPNVVGKNKKAFFQLLKDRMRQQIEN
ncbi:reverse transcriptase [Gossypium australe]|uniref:Reverse transcriptase n=1 Tax=Gossypium australe TaxID=47621 RepID=A0A5B6VPY7_9ROSI|nr:reverse transcriptase [Gossypium australe]